jgi:hypothetical protein
MPWALTQQNDRMPAELAALLPDGLSNLSPQIAASLPEAARLQALFFYSTGFHAVFWFVGGIYLVLLVLTLMLKDVEIPKRL